MLDIDMETRTNYSEIISPEVYNQTISHEHLYIAEADQIIKELVEREVAENGAVEVVDLGCGPARMLPMMAQIPGVKLTGVDHDRVFLDYAEKVVSEQGLDVRLVFDNAEDYQHPVPVDVVYSQGFHHHVARDGTVEAYLRNVYAMLRDGGIYILGDEFLPEYDGEEDRQIKAIIWYAHIISNALADGFDGLALEEAKTLLDDLAEGEHDGSTKSREQLDLLVDKVEEINLLAVSDQIMQAEIVAGNLRRQLKDLAGETRVGEASIDLSRGDYKICDSVFREEVCNAGFEVTFNEVIGPLVTIGAMVVYVLARRNS